MIRFVDVQACLRYALWMCKPCCVEVRVCARHGHTPSHLYPRSLIGLAQAQKHLEHVALHYLKWKHRVNQRKRQAGDGGQSKHPDDVPPIPFPPPKVEKGDTGRGVWVGECRVLSESPAAGLMAWAAEHALTVEVAVRLELWDCFGHGHCFVVTGIVRSRDTTATTHQPRLRPAQSPPV